MKRIKSILSLLFLGLISQLSAATYYSQATAQPFSNLANWNSVAGGGGSNPIAADLTSGAHTFVVQNTHTITLNQDINVAALSIGSGASGTLTIGNSTTARNIVIAGALSVNTGATLNVGAFDAVHTMTVGGSITSSGATFNLRNTATRVCNVTMNGTSFPQILGTLTPTFNNLTISCGGAGMDISRAITVSGDFLINANTPVSTAFGHTITGSFTVTAGSSFTPSGGTMTFNGASTQNIDLNNATFVAATFNTGNKTLLGNLTATGLVTLTGVTVTDAAGNHTLTGGLTITSPAVLNWSGTVNFTGNLTTSHNFNPGTLANPTSMGTATWTFNNTVTLALAAPATAGRFDFSGDLTINAGTTNIQNNTHLYSSSSSIIYLNNASVLQVSGLIGASTNFPENFSAYDFALTSTVRYNSAGAQTIKGGISVINGYGILDVRNNTKTIDGDLDINGNLALNTVTADFSGFNVNLAGSVTATGACALSNNQQFTLDADNANQTLAAGCTYAFNNLEIVQASPTASRTKTIGANLSIDGNFNITNAGGSSAILNIINLQNFTISDASPSGTWTLGTNVRLDHSGTAAEFQNSLNAFTTISFDATPSNMSIVRFNNTTNGSNQDIPFQNTSGPFAYGTIEFNAGGASGTKTALGPLNIDGSIYRVGGAPSFVDGNFSHTIAGDWLLAGAYYTPGATATITLDGSASQFIGNSGYGGAYSFPNLVIANTGGPVSINYNVGGGWTTTIFGNVTINNGAELDASTRLVSIRGDWTQLGTGIYTQTTGTTTFSSSTADQTITIATPTTSYFGNLTITKNTGAAPQTVTAASDFVVFGALTLTNNRAILDGTNRTITVGGNWNYQANTNFISTGGTVIFNGSTTQTITNAATSVVFNNITFTGVGNKNFSNNAIQVDGNFDFTGTNVSWGGASTLTLLGNWINTAGTGTFTPSTGTVLLNGGAQNIGTSTFNNLTCSGTALSTKTLLGDISLNNAMTINANITLDVSISNYNISVGGAWTNSGSFTAQQGTVTLTGNNAAISTGATAGPSAGKNFYNLIVLKTAGQAATFAAGSDLVCTNNLTITTGQVTMNTSSDVYVGAAFSNAGIINFNNNACVLNLNASSGSHTFDPGTNVSNVYRAITINASGVNYTLGNNLTVTNGQAFTLTAGNWDLNGKQMSMTGGAAVTVITVAAGTFDVDAGAILRLANQNIITINNASSVFKVVGSASSFATITTNGTSANGYNINQSAGVFHAKYFVFSNLRTTGIVLSGSATIDATNNITSGQFTAPSTSGCTQYLDVSGINLTSVNSLTTSQFVSFSTGATNNIKCNPAPSAGTINFQYASGALAGEAYDNDAAAHINWTNTPGVFWTGLGGDNNWYTAANWSSDPTIPNALDYVFLDHSTVGGAYQVNIATPGAVCAQLNIDNGGGAAITLALAGTGDLTVSGNVNNYTGNTISTAVAANVINVSGSWSNQGTFTATNGTVNLNGTSGTQTITTGGSAFYNLSLSGAGGASYQLASNVTINGDYNQTQNTLDVSNYDITANGNWSITGSGVFNPQTRTVTLSKAGTSNQDITGGYFFNLSTSNATAATTSTKTFLNGSTILGALTIGSAGAGNTQIIAGSFSHFINGNFTNNHASGLNAGTSTINFAGTTGTQTIGGTQSTTFNAVTMSGAAQKTLSINTAIDGDWQISSGSGQVNINAGVAISNASLTGTFTIAGASTLMVMGTFPTTFETVNLASNSTVQYEQNGAVNVYPTTYGTLILSSLNNGTPTTKTATGNITAMTALNLGTAGADNAVTFDMAGFTFTLSGTVLTQQTGAPQITWGATGTMVQDGAAWTIDADITGFNNLTLGGSGTKTLGNNLSILGDVIVQNGATLTMGIRTISGVGTETFTLQSGSALTCAITASNAFPSGFGTYTLSPTSSVTLNGAGAQTVACTGIVYGNLNFNPTTAASNTTLTNDLYVDGNFLMNANSILVDAGFDMYFSGTNIFIYTYPSPTLATSTINLTGSTQNIYGLNGGTLTLGNVVFGGTALSAKSLGRRAGVSNSTPNIRGMVTINTDITVNCIQNVNFSGPAWTNNGTFSHTANTFTYNGTGNQTINPGISNTYYAVSCTNTNNPGVVFTTNGSTTSTTTNIAANARMDMGGAAAPATTLTHTFGGAITNAGYWTTTNAHLVLNGGNYAIPVNDAVTPGTTFTARNVSLGGNGTKSMAATTTWTVEDLTIGGTTNFNPGNAANTLNVRGNWTNTSTFTHNNNTVNFNGSSTIDATINITAGNSNFFNVTFTPSNAVSYTLQSASTNITADLSLNANATLNLNSTTLTLGRSTASAKTYTVNGVIYGNENSTLRFDNRGGAVCTMTVTGAGAGLRLVGTSSAQVATLTSVGATHGTAITVTAGAEIQAKYYTIEYLGNAGLVVTATAAAIHPTNNFSEGTWQNMNTAAGGTRYYLDCDAPSPGTTISNVTFGWGGALPIPANRFNVRRTGAASGNLDFVDIISGAMGSYLYESDDLSATTGKITWPPIIPATWEGDVSSDWNDGLNWSTGIIPDMNTDCTIPTVVSPNVSPIINATSGAATCRNLIITNGRLDCNGGIIGIDLTVHGSIDIGTTGAGILAVGNADCTIDVRGAWTRGTVAGTSFIHGNGTVSFNAVAGAYTITPRTTGNFAFGNIDFNGAISSYNIVGGLTSAGDFTINNATVNPATGITINIAGDYANNGGVYTTTPAVTSTIVLNGTTQAVSNATFYNLTVSNSGTKTMSGTCTVYNNTLINTGCTLVGPSGADVLTLSSGFAGTMTINGTGVFSDGGGSHFFNGPTWTAGTSSGSGSSGTVIFNRNNAQTLAGGQFNNLSFTSSGNIIVSAASAVTGSTTVNLTAPANTITLNNNVSITGNNTVGVFTLAANHTMNVNGTNNCPSGFAAYALDATTTTNYTQAFDQVVGGISYGNLTLNTVSVKTLAGDIIVLGNLNFGTSTLDVSASNYSITVGGNYNNNNTGSLRSNGGNHAGTLTLDGSGAQNINNGGSGSKSIYNLVISKSAGTASVVTNNLTVLNDLSITSGAFTLNGFTGNVGGSLLISGGGSNTPSGTFLFNASTGAPSIQLNGSALNIVTINAPAITYTAQDNLQFNGNFTLTAGTLDGNGKYVYLGNTAGRTINIAAAGTYKIGSGGTMALGPTAAVTVDGTIEAVGAGGGSIATITKNTAGSNYSFSVNGNIKAQYYLFEYMASTGFQINAAATIDVANNFSDGTFTNGPNNCKYLTVDNTQTMTINNVSFPVVPTGSPNNVVKASAGVLTFYNSTGAFAGATYEGSDDGVASTGRIQWTGPATCTWIGALSTDWFTAGNWSYSLGGNQVPTSTDNAIIATNAWSRHPTLNASGAVCKNLTINNTMIVTLATGAGTGDLVISGDATINGSMVTSSNNDFIEVEGSWTKAVAGTINFTSGTVTFNGSSTKTINNGTGQFHHLIFTAPTATYLLGANSIVNGDLTINSGTFDVSGSFYNLTVRGAWINSGGTFNARTGSTALVTLNSSTVGSIVLNPGTSSFNRLTITGGVSTIYTLTSNPLSTSSNVSLTNGTLDLNGLAFNMGDNAGVDILTLSGGTLEIDANASLKMGTGSSVAVNSGATIKVVGTDASNVATITKQTAGSTYAFAVNAGATIHAQYYLFEYMNIAGIVVNPGATINGTDDFRNGSFANGTAGGKFLDITNDFADYTVQGVIFGSGPAINVSRTAGTGIITFDDPTGPLANYLYEEDDASAATGLIQWLFTNPQLTWTGAIDTDWQNPLNWATTGPAGPPDNTMDITIPNVANDPVLTSNAFVKDLNIGTGAVVNTGSFSIDVNGSFANTGGTFTSTGTVNFVAATGTPTISTGGSCFFNMVVNASVAYATASSICVNNNLTLNAANTLTVANAAHTITVTGNWNSTGATFTHGNGTVIMNENSGASSITTGASGAGGCTFYNLSVTQPVATVAKTVTLTGNLTVANALSISGTTCTFSCGTGNTVQLNGSLTINTASTFAGGSSTINLSGGNWLNSVGLPFSFGTSTVVFNRASAAQSITRASGESFYNLTINNTFGTSPQVTLAKPVTVRGTLTLTSGIVSTTSTNVLTMAAGSTATIGSATSYINGPMIYTVAASGLSNINFPVGKSTGHRPFILIVTHSSAASVNYTGELISSSAQSLGYTLPATISNVSGQRYWQIDRSGAANLTNALVNLFYSTVGIDDQVTDFANLAVVKNVGVGTTWNDLSGSATANGIGNILSGSFNTFSRFALANKVGGGNALPIELISFEGKQKDKENHLEWVTSSERNSSYYSIERSSDHKNYEQIGIVYSKDGNANYEQVYEFVDKAPLKGLNYYRLKQFDKNGEYEYHKSIVIEYKEDQNEALFEMYPNPIVSGNSLQVLIENTFTPFEQIVVTLKDQNGKEVYSGVFVTDEDGQISKIIELNKNIPSGVYLVSVSSNQKLESKLLIIE